MRSSNIVNRSRPQSVRTTDDARAHAAADLRDGLTFIGAAFNLAGNAQLRYTWDAHTRAEALEHCARLLICFRRGSITLRAGAVAQDDAALQRFLAEIGDRPNAS